MKRVRRDRDRGIDTHLLDAADETADAHQADYPVAVKQRTQQHKRMTAAATTGAAGQQQLFQVHRKAVIPVAVAICRNRNRNRCTGPRQIEAGREREMDGWSRMRDCQTAITWLITRLQLPTPSPLPSLLPSLLLLPVASATSRWKLPNR